MTDWRRLLVCRSVPSDLFKTRVFDICGLWERALIAEVGVKNGCVEDDEREWLCACVCVCVSSYCMFYIHVLLW